MSRRVVVDLPELDDALVLFTPLDARRVLWWLRGQPGVPWEALIISRVCTANDREMAL